MMNSRKGLTRHAAAALMAIMCHAAIGASSYDVRTTSHAISVDASGDDTASMPDFDGDGTIGFGDFVKFAAKYGLSQGDQEYDVQYDLNGDGGIGFSDFLIFAENFGKDAPSGGDSGRREWGPLTLHVFEVSDSTLTAGQAFTLKATLQSRERISNSIADLHYYRSLDATIDVTDANINRDFESVDMESTAIQTVSLDWTAPSYAGTYYYGVCNGDWRNKFNACSAAVRVTVEGNAGGHPDVSVSPPWLSHARLTLGTRFTWIPQIENIGTGRVAPTSLRGYLSEDATIDATDRLIYVYSYHYPSRGTITLVSPDETGAYYVGYCVDPVPGETNIDNNCSVGVPLIVDAGGGSPDLIVRMVRLNENDRTTRDLQLGMFVINVGPGTSAPTVVRLYRSDESTIDATDTPIHTENIKNLAAESHHGLEGDWGITAPASPGTYYYTFCVDPVPGESNTTNNCSETVPINVGVPDLDVGLAQASTSALLAGQSFTLTATVRNQGPRESAATSLRWYLSDDAAIDATDTPIGTEATGSLAGFDGLVSGPGSHLAASGLSRQSFNATAPSRPGTYYYGACVDGVPGESNTDNNCSAGAHVRVVSSGEDPFNIELVFVSDFTDARKDVMRQAARRWETIITEGLPDVDFSAHPFRQEETIVVDDSVDDLRVFVYKVTDADRSVAAFAGPVYVRSGPTGLPALGDVFVSSFFLDNNNAAYESFNKMSLWYGERILRDLMVHEIAHVLGFGSLWQTFGLVHQLSGDAYFSGESAIQAFNAAGGETYDGNKVPVTSAISGSCGAGTHWNPNVFRGLDRLFGAEVMEPTLEKEHALSAITIQSIADLGYVVDVSLADSYRLPASVSDYQPPTASAKFVATHDFALTPLGTIYVGDEQGNIIRTIRTIEP